jgi:hypothetical protein
MSEPYDVTFHNLLIESLTSKKIDRVIEECTRDKDWESLATHLESLDGMQFPSIGDYLNVPDLSDEGTRRLLCRTPRVTAMLLCWESARVLSHIQFRVNEALETNPDDIDSVTGRYKVPRQGMDRLFRVCWMEPLAWEQSQIVMQWMYNNGHSILHVGEPKHMFHIANDVEGIIKNWQHTRKKAVNRVRYRASVISQHESAIRSIPEFGQYFES